MLRQHRDTIVILSGTKKDYGLSLFTGFSEKTIKKLAKKKKNRYICTSKTTIGPIQPDKTPSNPNNHV